MDTVEVKKLKEELERDISEMLKTFAEMTGVKIKNINVYKTLGMTEVFYSVNIEVTI